MATMVLPIGESRYRNLGFEERGRRYPGAGHGIKDYAGAALRSRFSTLPRVDL